MIRARINEIKNINTINKISESLFFGNITKIGKPLVKLLKKKTMITKIRFKIVISFWSIEIGRIIREYCELLYVNKLDNPVEMNKYLKGYKLPKLTQEEIESMNGSITSRDWIRTQKISHKEKPMPR